jgi:GMP synthase-like glutamine amidotransferase
MRLTIIETGRPPEVIAHDFPCYPTMMETMLRQQMPELVCETISLVDGAPLPDQSDMEAVLITGSPVGVYDPVAWIAPLEAWIVANSQANIPQVGICFGHQIMAQAFGGVAAKAPQGWGLGRHDYALTDLHGTLPDAPRKFSLAVSHQDQVLTPPPSAHVVGHSEFTPFAALHYPAAPALSFQGHPEFCPKFAEALIRSRRGTRFPEALADKALDSLNAPLDGDFVGGWIAHFYRNNVKKSLIECSANAA